MHPELQKHLKTGAEVIVRNLPSYFERFLRVDLLRIKKGDIGTVIGVAGTGKIAVQFEKKVWASVPGIDFSTDCHGKGKKDYCLYFPADCLVLSQMAPETDKELDDEACQLTYQADQRLLLLIQ